MRSLTRREALSRILPATISKSFQDVWVEGATTVAIPERPDPRHVGAQLIVDLDITALVNGDAGLVQAKIVGVRAPANTQQEMGADDLRLGSTGLDGHRDLLALLF